MKIPVRPWEAETRLRFPGASNAGLRRMIRDAVLRSGKIVQAASRVRGIGSRVALTGSGKAGLEAIARLVETDPAVIRTALFEAAEADGDTRVFDEWHKHYCDALRYRAEDAVRMADLLTFGKEAK